MKLLKDLLPLLLLLLITLITLYKLCENTGTKSSADTYKAVYSLPFATPTIIK